MEYDVEKWCGIDGFPGYQVSNYGRVRSLKGVTGKDSANRLPKILKQNLRGNGYPSINLCHDGEVITQYVHHLVATAFLGKRPIGMDVMHKDHNKQNNFWENLKYGTRSENYRHSLISARTGRQKLLPTEVKFIRKHCTSDSIKSMAKRFGVCRTTIWNIINNKTWNWL